MDREIERALKYAGQEAELIKSGEVACAHSEPIVTLATAYRRLLAENAEAVVFGEEMKARAEKAEAALASMTIMRDEWRAMYAALKGVQP